MAVWEKYLYLHSEKQTGDDSVAQLVEQYTFNVWALGSSPSGITSQTKPLIITRLQGFFRTWYLCLLFNLKIIFNRLPRDSNLFYCLDPFRWYIEIFDHGSYSSYLTDRLDSNDLKFTGFLISIYKNRFGQIDPNSTEPLKYFQ